MIQLISSSTFFGATPFGCLLSPIGYPSLKSREDRHGSSWLMDHLYSLSVSTNERKRKKAALAFSVNRTGQTLASLQLGRRAGGIERRHRYSTTNSEGSDQFATNPKYLLAKS